MENLWSIISTVFGWVWTFLVSLTHLFWPVGQIISLIYLGIIIWAIRRFTPESVKRVVAERASPIIRSTSTPIRWYLVTWLANTEWLAGPGGGPRVVEKRVEVPVRVPMRRSFRDWAMSSLRWVVVGAVLASVGWNWTTVFPYISQALKNL